MPRSVCHAQHLRAGVRSAARAPRLPRPARAPRLAARDAAPRRQHLGDRARRGGLSVPLPPGRGGAARRPHGPAERAHERRLARARARRGALVPARPRRRPPARELGRRDRALPRDLDERHARPRRLPRLGQARRLRAPARPQRPVGVLPPGRRRRLPRRRAAARSAAAGGQVALAASATWPRLRRRPRVSTTVEPCGAPTSSRSRSPLPPRRSASRRARGRSAGGIAAFVLAGLALRARSAHYIVVWAVAPLLFWATYPDPSASLAAVALGGLRDLRAAQRARAAGDGERRRDRGARDARRRRWC